MTTINQIKAEFAHDLEVGLARKSVPEFEHLPTIGMAGKLALHIRGLGELEGGVLRQVADHFFDIPAVALPGVLTLLEEIEYVQLITEGKSIKKVIPTVPHFSSVYSGLGEYVGTITLNEHEEVAIAMLSELRSKPEKRDALINRIGVATPVFGRIESITTEGGLIVPKRARGQDILISPFYFADNLDSLASQAAAGGARSVERILTLIQKAQGWPLSLILARGEINGSKLTPQELQILQDLIADGVLRPPSLSNAKTRRDEHFVFTPHPGAQRLDGAAREIYERTMALVAAVRKGQLLPQQFRIRSPQALLGKLRSAKRIGASTEAAAQYRNLVALRVGRLERVRDDWFEFVLIDEPENIHAVDDAISLFEDGEPLSAGVSEEARIALQRDESYIQSIVAAQKLRSTARPALDAQAHAEMEQLFLDLR
ncbi:hypothetical protein [Burkholderia glumae]|uniref:hypothetical protein n=1 Tax=Burkholderia glumae TaxID=337 RepID=UPI0012F840E7|nr:hypothetical protein [Burkholderia glumae]MCM2485802.1 hypothetical protein [Burkholderia glumae]MCM2511634.1 hypothetical protein [Burkholderia glumae]MCM2541841.1 hypothetical protein [Burkholderia glumae]